MDCDFCGEMMTKIEVMNSGNSIFYKYLCKTCQKEKTICQGTNTNR